MDRPPVIGHRPQDQGEGRAEARSQGAVLRLAFKTVSEPTGDLVFLRIYSGELQPKDDVLNTTVNRSERIGHIYRMMGDRRDRLEVAGPGRDRRRRRPEADVHRQHALRQRHADRRWKRFASPSR